jgi:hypothetical protein
MVQTVTVVTTDNKWLFLAYRLPREPSAPRLALWRALRRLGASLLGDGLAALPASPRNLEHMEWLAAGIEEARGTASVWHAQPAAGRTHAQLEDGMRRAVDEEYQAVLEDARTLRTGLHTERRRAVRRLRGQLRRIASRDYFAAPTGAAARDEVDRLAAMVEEVTA